MKLVGHDARSLNIESKLNIILSLGEKKIDTIILFANSVNDISI